MFFQKVFGRERFAARCTLECFLIAVAVCGARDTFFAAIAAVGIGFHVRHFITCISHIQFGGFMYEWQMLFDATNTSR